MNGRTSDKHSGWMGLIEGLLTECPHVYFKNMVMPNRFESVSQRVVLICIRVSQIWISSTAQSWTVIRRWIKSRWSHSATAQ